MINNIQSKLLEKLLHLKSDKLRATVGPPKQHEGLSGDVTIRRIENKLALYGKFNNAWFKFAETDANAELKEVPEISAATKSGLIPDFTTGWFKVIGSDAQFTGKHRLAKIPSLHQLWFSPDSTTNKVYNVSGGNATSGHPAEEEGVHGHTENSNIGFNDYSLELDHLNYVLRRIQAAGVTDASRGWGAYVTSGTEAIQIGQDADADTVGYFKLNLWK